MKTCQVYIQAQQNGVYKRNHHQLVPVFWLASCGIALTVWAWAIKRKARLDIDQATKLILEHRYRNGQIFKEEYE